MSKPLRVGRYKRLPNNGRFGKDVVALATTGVHRVIIFANDPTEAMGGTAQGVDDGMNDEVAGPDVKIQLLHDTGARYQVNLSRMTEEELRTLKDTLDFAFNEALPICRERDTIAKKAADDGNGDYFRLYRQAPRLSFPSRKVGKDESGLHVGHQGILDPDGSHDSRHDGAASGSSSMVEPDSANGSPRLDNVSALGIPPLLG